MVFNFRLPGFLLLLAVVTLSGCDGPPEDTDPVSESAEITRNGGSVTLYDERGITFTLSIPDGALKETTTVTLTSVGRVLDSPFAKTAFPGLTIGPVDLLLKVPATLTVDFEGAGANLEKTVVAILMNGGIAMPLCEHTTDVSQGTLEGEIYFLGSCVGVVPTTEEILDQIDLLEQKYPASLRSSGQMMLGGCPPIGYGWQGTRTMVGGLLHWGDRLVMLGDPGSEQGAIDAAREVVEEDVESFLEQEMPTEPCGSYAMAAFRYGEAAAMLGVETQVADDIQKRIEELTDQCSIRFRIEIDKELKKTGDEKETLTTYGSVTSYIPFSDFADGNPSIKGEGSLSYSWDYNWKYHEDRNCNWTGKGSGTVQVTCGGSLSSTVDSAGQVEYELHVTLKYENDLTGQKCDTCDDENPCVDIVDNDESNETVDFPLVNGSKVGTSVTFEEGSARDYKTLYIINMPGEDSGDESDCY